MAPRRSPHAGSPLWIGTLYGDTVRSMPTLDRGELQEGTRTQYRQDTDGCRRKVQQSRSCLRSCFFLPSYHDFSHSVPFPFLISPISSPYFNLHCCKSITTSLTPSVTPALLTHSSSSTCPPTRSRVTRRPFGTMRSPSTPPPTAPPLATPRAGSVLGPWVLCCCRTST